MTNLLAFLHIYAAACAFILCGFLLGAGRSQLFRLRLIRNELERSYSFQVVSIFLFALGMDLSAAPLEVNGAPHTASILLACVTGTLALTLFSWRVLRWSH